MCFISKRTTNHSLVTQGQYSYFFLVKIIFIKEYQ